MSTGRCATTASLAALLAIACGRRDATTRPDPSASIGASSGAPSTTLAPSASAIAPSAPPPSSEVPSDGDALRPPYQCVDAELRTAGAAIDVSTLDARTGVVLPAAGHGRSGKGPAPSVVAALRSPSGLSGLPAARALCDASPALRACLKALRPRPTPRLIATYAIDVRADGSASGAHLAEGTVSDAALDACFARALGGLAFAAGTPAIRYDLDVAPGLPAGPQVRLRRFDTVGPLPPEVIKRIARARFPKMQACYEALLRATPDVEGTVSTTFLIGTSGATESARTAAGTIGDATLRACVQKVFEQTEWPETEGGKQRVTYELELSVW